MRTFRRYSKLYWEFFKQQTKVMMEYRVDFFIGMFSVFFIQFTSVFFVKVVFDQIPAINGWTFYEVMFIYGIASTGRSIHHIFFDNLWVLGSNYIRPGNFDRLLIRPINPLFHLIADRVQQDGFGQLLIGVIILVTAVTHLPIHWGFVNILMLIVMVFSSGFIFVGLNLFFSTLSFWMTDSLPVVVAVFRMSDFTRYPLTIYSRGLRLLLTWIIPYGFTAFYPAAYLLQNKGYQFVGMMCPIVAIVTCGVAYGFWKMGLRSFTATGS